MKKGGRIVLIVIAAAGIFYCMPFITVSVSDGSGHSWRVPFASFYQSQTEDSVLFTTWRSAYATGKDAANAMHSYEESECYGTTYYYDASNDVSYTGYAVSGALPGTLTYSYVQGNACAGWTEDDEVAWEDGDPLDVSADLTIDEALENSWIVIADGEIQNPEQYNDFSRMVKQGLYCMKRTVFFEDGVLVRIIDVQQMSDASIQVTTVENGEKTVESYGRFTEAEVDGQVYAVVYQGLDKDEEPTLLYPCQ